VSPKATDEGSRRKAHVSARRYRADPSPPTPLPQGERGTSFALIVMHTNRRLIESIEAEGVAALVNLVETRGSSPREAGAAMVVRPSGGFHGTIGGGAMEWRALAEAREAIAHGRGAKRRSVVSLGPDLAQCCGGRVEWRIETFDRRDLESLRALADAEGAGAQARPVYLFGAGHVGRALALALAPLPFALRWIDSREGAFPERAPANATLVQSADPSAELAGAPDGALVLVMTHSHPLDLAIVAEALRQDRFGFVGLIGSATKRARFLSQMRAAGLTEAILGRLVCPIGVPGIEGKEPAVIAAATAAQLLGVSDRLRVSER
jgi:xanthine dehydrogenase accessory factor